ncbi:hypothetical protein [Cellulomonas sp.]|uniref:hypothetical protein n=1 Tax=Cellulomonas sp. TaxID=40001 RepID=UPI001B0E7FB2|nr:hypothetical protein [Cellulomonas sp.]MBO9555597.1 hypothetical protein [Cellulomonas sp.]
MSAGTFVLPDVEAWDLWGVYAGDLRSGFEVIPYDDTSPREVRVYRSIPARAVHYLASRATSRDTPTTTITLTINDRPQEG